MLTPEANKMLSKAYADKSVCVTGAAGFLGGHLVDALLEVGATVHAIDDLSASTLEHLGEKLAIHPDTFKLTYGSILDDVAIREAIEGVDTIFHLASHGSHTASLEDPERTYEVNASGTLRVLQTARREEVARVVIASNHDARFIQGQASTPFAASKVSAEHLAASWAGSYGLHTVALRFTNIFGPRQRAETSEACPIAQHMTRATQGMPPLINASQRLDPIFVADAVRATLLAGIAPAAAAGATLDVASGRTVAAGELATLVCAACAQPDLRADLLPAETHTLPAPEPDLARTRDLIAFSHEISLEEGLQTTAAWYLALYGSAK